MTRDNDPFRPVGPAERVIVTLPHDDEAEAQDPRVGSEIALWKVSVY